MQKKPPQKIRGPTKLRQAKLHLTTSALVLHHLEGAAAAAAFKLKENRDAVLRRTEMKGRITKRRAREAPGLKWLTGKADGGDGGGVLVQGLHQAVVGGGVQHVDQTVSAGCGQQLQT